MNVTTEQKIDAVLAVTNELQSIKNDLALLHEHEAILIERAERCMAEITGSQLPKVAPAVKEQKATLAEMVTLALLMQFPASMSALEVAKDLNLDTQITSIRGTLSRLTAEGKIQKVGYGKYSAIVAGGETQP
jgi:hypothetical protein